ncbi:MAG TPA: hypothetical protein VKQ31_11645 [Steroidobacteraceae bacterium]|nr:hypothetical protein [Steroidobacteraceae bacterium]
MKAIRLIILSASMLGSGITLAQAQSISFGAVITGEVVPGVYGQVVIGDGPPPPLVAPQPVVIDPVPMGVAPPPPIYLHVPPGHAKHWRQHCHEYHACNRPVYFVRSAEYDPGFDRERWEREHGHGHGHHGDDRGDHGRDH